MMVYGAFAGISMHWLPWFYLFAIWGCMFYTNMVMKDRSLKRHDGWAAYEASSGMLLPNVSGLLASLSSRS